MLKYSIKTLWECRELTWISRSWKTFFQILNKLWKLFIFFLLNSSALLVSFCLMLSTFHDLRDFSSNFIPTRRKREWMRFRSNFLLARVYSNLLLCVVHGKTPTDGVCMAAAFPSFWAVNCEDGIKIYKISA